MKITFTYFLALIALSTLNAQISFSGQVLDQETNEALIGANVIFYQQNKIVSATCTDSDGHYKLKLQPGKYNVEITYIGYQSSDIRGVLVESDLPKQLNVNLMTDYINLEEVVVSALKIMTTGCRLICCCGQVTSPTPDQEPDHKPSAKPLVRLRLFPNPTNEYVVVELPKAVDQLQLYDSQGRLLQQFGSRPEGRHRLQLGDLPAGHYLIRSLGEARQQTARLMVQYPH